MGHTPVGISDPVDGSDARVLTTAPADTGQPGLLVRVISQNAATPVVGHVIVDSATIAALTDGTLRGTVAISGVPHVVIDSATLGTVAVSIASLPALSAGNAVIGHVIVDSGAVTATLAAETTKVIGTVNLSTGQTVGLAAGSAVIGHVVVDSATIAALTDGTARVGGTVVVSNAGTFAVQAALAAETTKVIGTVNIASGQTVGIAAGAAVIGHVVVDSGAVTVTNATPANLKVDPSGVTSPVTQTPSTSGGWSIGNFTSGDTYTALTNTAQVIKASAGQIGGWYIYNPNAAVAYVLVYNIAAASVTVGTSTAILVLAIPALGAANLEVVSGIPFATAMSCAAATTGGGNTAPTTALEALLFYK